MSTDLQSIAARAARKNKINPSFFLAQMGQENGFKPTGTSSAGAQGPAQIMPATAKAWGVKNVNDPEEAYNAAASHMGQYLKQYGGSWDKALTAYNAGPGRVGGPLPAETQAYIKNIRAAAKSTYANVPGASQDPALTHASLSNIASTGVPGSTQDASASRPSVFDVLRAYRSSGTDDQSSDSISDYGLGSMGSDDDNSSSLMNLVATLKARRDASSASSTPATTSDGSSAAVGSGTPGDPTSFARSRIGHYSENEGSNLGTELNKLQARFNMRGAPWCAMFATVAVNHSGGDIARTASVADIRAAAEKGAAGYEKGLRSTKDAQPGDLWMNGNEHVGVVESVDRKNGTVTNIEGNTSDGKVTRVTRPINSGDIARPKYRTKGSNVR